LAGIDAEIAKGDVEAPSSLPQTLKGVDLVIHCAGLTKANTRREYMSANADGTRALVQASIESGVRRFVFCSSQAAAGPATDKRPRVEEDPPEPLTDYGASKLEGEKAVREADGHLEWVVLRPPAIFGPRDSQFLPIFRAVTKLRRYPAFAGEERLYSWIYVRDFVAALRTVAEAEKGLGETYFVGSERPTTWRKVSQVTASVRGIEIRPFPTVPLPVLNAAARLCEWAAQLQGKAALFNRQKLAEIFRALGFRCQVTLEDAVTETVRWYEEQGLL
jgi:dihydroflavonol-4-reductase